MINFDGKELQEEFNNAFRRLKIVTDNTVTGGEVDYRPVMIQDLTPEQLWWLVKFAKHVRGRCRNNSAFNNYMNRNFAPARFREIPKEYEGRSYMGLEIKVGDKTSEGEG